MYKLLSAINDIKAIYKGRYLQRVWNKAVLKLVRGLLK